MMLKCCQSGNYDRTPWQKLNQFDFGGTLNEIQCFNMTYLPSQTSPFSM